MHEKKYSVQLQRRNNQLKVNTVQVRDKSPAGLLRSLLYLMPAQNPQEISQILVNTVQKKNNKNQNPTRTQLSAGYHL